MKSYKIFLSEVMAEMPSLIIKRNELFSHHTSFGVGGKIALYTEVDNEKDLIRLIKLCKVYDVDFFILGAGTNIIASDKRHDMFVIKVNIKKITVRGNKLICGGGASLFAINQAAQTSGLGGMEWSYGLPASIGGAVVMNAGCFGGEMKDIVECVYYTDGEKIYRKYAKSLDFSYRHSYFQGKQYVIFKVVLSLLPSSSEVVLHNCQKYLIERHSRQPFSMRSAGSIFKKPDGTFAPYLIEKCGLKGVRIGDAEISKKHCGFIVNLKNAKFNDVFRLICKIKKTVYKKFAIMLEEEVIIIE